MHTTDVLNRGTKQSKWKPLPGSAKEIQAIKQWYSLCYQKDQITIREKEEALEANFISEIKGKRWLHMATHGFFIDATKNDPKSFQTITDSTTYQQALLNPLSLSGLVLAGANALDKPIFPYNKLANIDDGYLSAGNISTLDLRGVKCVVLSCCETGFTIVSKSCSKRTYTSYVHFGIYAYEWIRHHKGL